MYLKWTLNRFQPRRITTAMVLWKKQESVEKKLERYFDDADICFERMTEAWAVYFDKGLGPEFEEAVNQTHAAESQADDIRREIELLLYGRALLPESRGDILGLLETYDGLPNIAETVVFVVFSQRMVLPEPYVSAFKDLIRVNTEAYALARKSVDALMTNPKATLATTKEVDQKESESDRIERQIICDIFDSDKDMGTKLLFKELVILIGEISDRAQKVADRIGLIAIKRQI
ncbi:MAG: DUF47 family protein [Myxococcota bacterium]